MELTFYPLKLLANYYWFQILFERQKFINVYKNVLYLFELLSLFSFTEFVCGMLGYVEFLWRDWLADILEWQSNDGCFTATKPHIAIGRKLLREEKLSGN